MGVHLRTSHFIYEVGSSEFFISFFDTIEIRLTKGLFGKNYPVVLTDFYSGKISLDKLETAEKELAEIRKRLKRLKPYKVVWDKNDLARQPPWGNEISEDVTNLSNYFVPSDGRDLFEVIFRAIEMAKKEKCELIIE
ncbi:immunity 70 family protein [Cyclobacterium qasimii]|uniref:Uncharacterized protein n=2 Tax=Cyclobacterium qasimii TaxID=1350429 RepID=S7VAC9_9BACT|nr:immunity 70 family protein [Cyclobacterium qasimii]EPR66901.1 hypothetical protein ADICYQ_4162 [Cyclobacterium qasimii M12-11B]GEO22939.1 hypothetical protein CQA01_34730 [Cyclobacterium qasimii]